MLLGSATTLASGDQVMDFVSYAQQRAMNLADTWIAERHGEMVGAILPIVSPGRTMLLLCSPMKIGDRAAGALIDAVCEHFVPRGIKLAQVLLEPGEPPTEALFTAHQFRRIAELIYLQGTVKRAQYPAVPKDMSWSVYSPQTHADFATTIVVSYRQSLDCPGLNGVRDIEDVLAGHKSSGKFDPRYWFLLRERGQGIGAILVSRLPLTDSAELVYLGLAPEARRRGLAALMMQQALAATVQMGASRLSLAVDSQNVPALKLYYRFGLAKAASKIAMMRELGERSQESGARSQELGREPAESEGAQSPRPHSSPGA
jgi:ribosomal protein S18 acetylase RimI-like enzyme